MRAFFCFGLVASVFASSVAAQTSPGVSITEKEDAQLDVKIDGKPFTVLNYGKDWKKPFLFPMSAPDGTNILRDIIPTKDQQGSSKDGTDHFHHKGVWVSVDSVNDEKLNFWHEDAAIVCNSVEHIVKDGIGVITVNNTWMDGDKSLLKETTNIVIHPSRLMSYHIDLQAIDKDVTFYDTKEGFFAVRIAHSMREMQGGHIVNADGLQGEKECWGKPTPWIDYFGEVNGKTCGVTLMDHPENFRKSRYHVRSYGLFSISPFGPKKYSNGVEEESPVKLSPGKDTLHLTYGLFVHNGNTAEGGVAEAYQEFLKATTH